MLVGVKGRLPTIPEYYMDFINKNVDLTKEPKQCCPFHKEDTPSFSYSAMKNVWRCFGACHCGGDVVDLHKKNYGFSSREEADKSLKAYYGVIEKVTLQQYVREVDNEVVYKNTYYTLAVPWASCPERWVQLDYVMSKTPVDTIELEALVHEWQSSK